MSIPRNSYLTISESALEKMRLLLSESPYEDPVIHFVTSHPEMDAMALDPDAISDLDIARVRSIVNSPDFFRKSTVLVDTVPRHKIPEECLVEFDGVWVNAPLHTAEPVTARLRMEFSEDRFRLEMEGG
jgi:hypothetical protein